MSVCLFTVLVSPPSSVEGRAERSPPGADLSSSGARPLRSTPSHEPGNAHAADPIGGMRVCACTQQIPIGGMRDLRGARSLIHEQRLQEDFLREYVYARCMRVQKKKKGKRTNKGGSRRVSTKGGGKRKEKRREQLARENEKRKRALNASFRSTCILHAACCLLKPGWTTRNPRPPWAHLPGPP